MYRNLLCISYNDNKNLQCFANVPCKILKDSPQEGLLPHAFSRSHLQCQIKRKRHYQILHKNFLSTKLHIRLTSFWSKILDKFIFCTATIQNPVSHFPTMPPWLGRFGLHDDLMRFWGYYTLYWTSMSRQVRMVPTIVHMVDLSTGKKPIPDKAPSSLIFRYRITSSPLSILPANSQCFLKNFMR